MPTLAKAGIECVSKKMGAIITGLNYRENLAVTGVVSLSPQHNFFAP